MTALETWLQTATRHLCQDSAVQVRTEIREHYESAQESALGEGSSREEADRLAIAALGDANVANRQYRRVLLTRGEMRLLRESNWEARAICSSRLVKWLLLSIPTTAVMASIWLFLAGGHVDLARTLLVGGSALGIGLVGPFLPIGTPSRAFIYRIVKWAAIASAIAVVYGSDALRLPWLLCATIWPIVWVEVARISIRRKLPVAEWPRQLYL
jgi:hypothetical protein